MLNKKSIGVALACALALGAWSGTTLAVPVNIGGVVIDSASPLDLSMDAINFRETSVAKVGDVLNGYGKIASINGTDQSTFCPGCNLNFTFQYTVSNIGGTSTNPQVVFDLGSVNLYVDNTSSFNVLHPATAGIGTLWLRLDGHTAPFTGFTALGQLYSTINGPVSNPGSQSSGFGLFDAVGGTAASYADTNTMDDGADFKFSSSFLTDIARGCSSTPSSDPSSLCHYPISGTAKLIGRSPVAVPEPGPAGILGIGLAALGLLLGRRRKEAGRA